MILTLVRWVRTAWAWLLRDYHWAYVLFPIGILLFLSRKRDVTVISPELHNADVVKEKVEEKVVEQERKAEEKRDSSVAEAQEDHAQNLSDLLHAQQRTVQTLDGKPDDLTKAMLDSGRKARQ